MMPVTREPVVITKGDFSRRVKVIQEGVGGVREVVVEERVLSRGSKWRLVTKTITTDVDADHWAAIGESVQVVAAS